MWIFIVVFLIVGCGQNRHLADAWPASIASISGFSQGEQTELVEALAELNAGVGQTILTPTPAGEAYPIHFQLVDDFEGHPLRAGFATRSADQCVIRISREVFDESKKPFFLSVVIHEVGHCGGLRHVTDEGEIMYTSSVPFSHYGVDARERFFRDLLTSTGLDGSTPTAATAWKTTFSSAGEWPAGEFLKVLGLRYY